MKPRKFLYAGLAVLAAAGLTFAAAVLLEHTAGIRAETPTTINLEETFDIVCRLHANPDAGGVFLRIADTKGLSWEFELKQRSLLFRSTLFPGRTGATGTSLGTGDFRLRVRRDDAGKLALFWREESNLSQPAELPFLILDCPNAPIRAATVAFPGARMKEFSVVFAPALANAGKAAHQAAHGLFVAATALLLSALFAAWEEPKSRLDLPALTAVLGFAALALLLFVVALLYNPDPIRPDLSSLLVSAEEVAPEPQERFLYVLALLAAPGILLSAVFLSKRATFANGGALALSSAICLLCFSSRIEFIPFGAAAAALVLTGVCFFWKRQKERIFRVIAGILWAAGGLFAFRFLAALFAPQWNFFNVHHLSALLHPLWLSCHGFVPGVDFHAQYGLYGLMLSPLFRLTGLSPAGFCAGFALLGIASLAAFACLLRRECRSWLAAAPGFAAIAAIPVIAGRPALYLQYFPLRVIAPSLFLLLASLEFRHPSRALRILIALFAALSVLWNPESGLVVLLTWFIALAYGLLARRAPLHDWLVSAAEISLGIGCGIGGFLLLVKLGFGKVPDLCSLLAYPAIFSTTGFFTLPMPTRGAWILLGAVYCATLAEAAAAIVSHRVNAAIRFRLTAAVLGCGIFSYYQSRSNDGNLLAVIYPGLILLAIYASRGLSAPDRLRHRLGAVAGFILLTLAATPFFTWQKSDPAEERQHAQLLFGVRQVAKLLDKTPERRLVPLAQFSSFYATSTNAVPAFAHTGNEELLLRADAVHALEAMTKYRGTPALVLIDKRRFVRLPEAQGLPAEARSGPGNVAMFFLPIAKTSGREYFNQTKMEKNRNGIF